MQCLSDSVGVCGRATGELERRRQRCKKCRKGARERRKDVVERRRERRAVTCDVSRDRNGGVRLSMRATRVVFSLTGAAPAAMAVSASASFTRLCVVCAAWAPTLEVTSSFVRDSLSLCGVEVLSERVMLTPLSSFMQRSWLIVAPMIRALTLDTL